MAGAQALIFDGFFPAFVEECASTASPHLKEKVVNRQKYKTFKIVAK